MASLKSFKIDNGLWAKFRKRAQKRHQSASGRLRQLIEDDVELGEQGEQQWQERPTTPKSTKTTP